MKILRAVLDTDVIVAALRSASGASAAILNLALEKKVRVVASTALFLEYESVLKRPKHGLSIKEVDTFLNEFLHIIQPVENYFSWRALLVDPDDEMVLEAAINGGADALVTFNIKDFSAVEGKFNCAIMTPRLFLEKVRS